MSHPQPPYVAVIFASSRSATPTDHGTLDYDDTAAAMDALVREQPGFLGVDSVSDGQRGITVSYWRDEEASLAWRRVAEHVVAQQRGILEWYDSYDLHVATVTRATHHPPTA